MENALRLREIEQVGDRWLWPYSLRFRLVAELCKAENQGRRLCRGDFLINFIDEDIRSLEPMETVTDYCSAVIKFVDFQAAFIGHGKLESLTNIRGVQFQNLNRKSQV